MSAPRIGRPAPPSVRAASTLLGVVSAYHLVIALATVLLQPLLRQGIALQHPGVDAAALVGAVASSTTLSLAVHAPLFLLTAVLAWRLPTGHPFALRPATVSQLFGVAFAFASTPPFPGLQAFVPLVIAAQAGVIGLLWLPPASRAFFAAHPRSRRSRKAVAVAR